MAKTVIIVVDTTTNIPQAFGNLKMVSERFGFYYDYISRAKRAEKGFTRGKYFIKKVTVQTSTMTKKSES